MTPDFFGDFSNAVTHLNQEPFVLFQSMRKPRFIFLQHDNPDFEFLARDLQLNPILASGKVEGECRSTLKARPTTSPDCVRNARLNELVFKSSRAQPFFQEGGVGIQTLQTRAETSSSRETRASFES
jgi:hypothetical protein